MPLEDLWKLHEEVISALASRVEAQKLELEKRLEQLGTRFGGSPTDLPKARPYPRVSPKFRNLARGNLVWTRQATAMGSAVAGKRWIVGGLSHPIMNQGLCSASCPDTGRS
jgi:hypothetical protein